MFDTVGEIDPDDLSFVVNPLAFSVYAKRIIDRGPSSCSFVKNEAVFGSTIVEITANDLVKVIDASGDGAETAGKWIVEKF